MKKAAVINDLSSFGRCSLTAAIPVISALGVECCPLVTGVFSNQTDYDSYYGKDLTDFMTPCINQWKKMNFSFDAILTGYIASTEQGKIISDMIDSFSSGDTLIVVDPVMGDDGKAYKDFGEDRIKSVKALTKKAHIITPNLTELCMLNGENYEALCKLPEKELFEAIEKLSRSIYKAPLKAVITTGIHLQDKIANTVYKDGKLEILTVDFKGERFSGTGDIFSSFITAQCVKGKDVTEAVKSVSEFICKAIEITKKDTDENYNKNDGVHFEKILYTLGEYI